MNKDRRRFFAQMGIVASAVASHQLFANQIKSSPTDTNKIETANGIRWVSTAIDSPWQDLAARPLQTANQESPFTINIHIQTETLKQKIEGFGGAFSELGWQALLKLPTIQRDAALDGLFSSKEANFTICRTPMGASDFARGWYSYDETPDDFQLENFSIENDKSTLIPYIQAAQARQQQLKIWASPWSPPSWMKTNNHYAMAPAWPGQPSNGIQNDQLGLEGQDYFILEPTYLSAYANYFKRYVEAYKLAGIDIYAVMPQNEFNSAQPFPSCCWTPQGLATFLPYLAQEMQTLDVDILLGTLERANPDLVAQVLESSAAKAAVKGVGVQWAGKGALPFIQKRHPDLAIWASEHECGTGTNDWHFARYSWELIKTYLNQGTSAYHYWNMVLESNNKSTWGWPQNSLITVDPIQQSFKFNPDYYVLKHLSHFVQPGAHFIPATSFTGYDNQLAFKNPDQSLVLVINNALAQPLPIKVKIGDKLLTNTLPADSYNTFHIAAEAYLHKNNEVSHHAS